jgi:hypothetical protein
MFQNSLVKKETRLITLDLLAQIMTQTHTFGLGLTGHHCPIFKSVSEQFRSLWTTLVLPRKLNLEPSRWFHRI